ncbi:hypothetical protein D3C72_2365740 [compost metagenome]
MKSQIFDLILKSKGAIPRSRTDQHHHLSGHRLLLKIIIRLDPIINHPIARKEDTIRLQLKARQGNGTGHIKKINHRLK